MVPPRPIRLVIRSRMIEVKFLDIFERHIGKSRQIGIGNMDVLDAERGLGCDCFGEHSGSFHTFDGRRNFEVIC